jgi:PAS domain S-box-containing protein
MANLTIVLAALVFLLVLLLAFLVMHFQTRLATMQAPASTSDPAAALPSLKQHFGDWYQNAPMGFHTLDANGVVTDMNETELTWLGYQRNEVVGVMHVSALLTEKSKEILRNAATRPKTYGGSGYLEYEALRKDGTILHLLAYDLPYKNSRGEIIGYHVADVDISLRKCSEEKLQLSEANFVRAQGLAHVGHYEFDIGNDKFPDRGYWSKELFRIFGRDPAAGALSFRETIDQCIHSEDRRAAEDYLRETFAGNHNMEREIRIARPDGSVRYINGVARFSYGEGQRPDKLFGVVMDITDLKLAQEKIDRSERRFRAMIEKTDETIALFSRDGIVMYASPSAATLMGVAPEKLIGKHVWALIHPDDVPAVSKELQAVISVPGSTIFSQFRTPHPSGDWRWVESAETNRLDDPDIGAIIVNVRDITGRKAMEQALRESNTRLRELSTYLEEVREKERADIAQALHDEVGQHYAGLQMGIHWLEQRHKDDAPSVERTTLMRGLMTRAFSTIRNIIQSLHPPMLDDLGLAGAMDALVEDFSQHSALKIEFNAAACEGLPKAHQLALFRGLQEALTNVSRHAHATHVNIQLDRDHANVRLTITDNGSGMSPSARERKGSFGLFGMSERIKALGGNFDIRSEPGAGTSIHLSVPINTARILEKA